jgi:hypothetical protein
MPSVFDKLIVHSNMPLCTVLSFYQAQYACNPEVTTDANCLKGLSAPPRQGSRLLTHGQIIRRMGQQFRKVDTD